MPACGRDEIGVVMKGHSIVSPDCLAGWLALTGASSGCPVRFGASSSRHGPSGFACTEVPATFRVSSCPRSADASHIRPVRDRTPALGFSNTAPPSFISREVSPAGVSADLGPVLPHTVRVPPTWSLTTSTACSLGARAGLLHPATDPGVHRVSAPRRGVCIRLPVCARSVSCLLSDARPSALFPRVQPRRRHRRLLPPRRCPTCLPTRPRGLAPHPRP
jgi:hypothetical protein